MNRRLLTAVGAAALMVATVMPMGVTAARPRLENQAKRFERVDTSKIDKSLIKSILSDHDVNVIVEMTGPSATARGGSKVQQVAVAGRLKAHQDALARSVRKMGGTVEAKYQYAYNGIKVRLPSRKIAALAKQPGVKAIHPVATYTVDNRRSVPFIGAPAVWQDFGDTGSGQTIAVIDTGIDYTHANFGGAGTEAAYDDNDSTVIEPGSFPTAKVIAGWDFVGDAYNPDNTDGTEIPAPDPDPLDCNGHGSHVAGTAAGFGVKSDHTTYTGPYNSTTYSTSFGIGPGVAPKAKLVSLKVFGCDGGTNVLTDALEWVGTYNATHADAIDVVNMSIGGVGGNEHPGRPGQQHAGGIGRRGRRLGRQRGPQRVHDRRAGQRHGRPRRRGVGHHPELPGRDDRPHDRRRPQRHQRERLARPAGDRHPQGDHRQPGHGHPAGRG